MKGMDIFCRIGQRISRNMARGDNGLKLKIKRQKVVGGRY